MKKISGLLAMVVSLLIVLSVTGGTIWVGWNYIVKPDLIQLQKDLPQMKAEMSKTVNDVKAMPLRESVPLVIGTTLGTGFLVWDMWKNRLFDSHEDSAKIKARLPFNFRCLKWGSLAVVLSIPLTYSVWTISIAILLFGIGLNVTVASLVCLTMTPVRLVSNRVFRALDERLSRTRE